MAEPSGEGRIATDGGRLRAEVEAWRALFLDRLARPDPLVLPSATPAVTAR
jgi:hypothetical protein